MILNGICYTKEQNNYVRGYTYPHYFIKIYPSLSFLNVTAIEGLVLYDIETINKSLYFNHVTLECSAYFRVYL